MYKYDQYDQRIVNERATQFRTQVERFLGGKLSEEEFRPLRLMNGLYMQRHAPMLRVAIPYGLLSSGQMRMLAHIARVYDKGYGHFSTRQNIQYNWPQLEKVPDILDDLASVEMHAIQTSGNCVRNITSDHLAGVAPDELINPLPYCEILRQWSTLHPEFAYLPRKFKIAVIGASNDRAAVQFHDIGLQVVKNKDGETGFRVLAGGGQGRTPVIGSWIREFLAPRHLLSYLESVLRVYNRLGERKNRNKARIKILLRALGTDKFIEMVERDWQYADKEGLALDEAEVQRVSQYFSSPEYNSAAADDHSHKQKLLEDADFSFWYKNNVSQHKAPGYRAVYIQLKAADIAPGDATAEQMEAVADMADRYSFAEIRVAHSQNLVLAHVPQGQLYELWQQLVGHGLATPNNNLLTDTICCPGLDFCSLANASSISLAQELGNRFNDQKELEDIGPLNLKISGCMNACGHHHVGHIGILGVDKRGEEFYQLTLGGEAGNNAAIGARLGKAIAKDQVLAAIENIIATYKTNRTNGESFIEAYQRLGIKPFQAGVYNEDN
ncbi:MAG: nitrite/sulfite reductase [Candidatus Porifericomitaceae bacterium WSBS_2022_MAG_OTU9]